jgi:hypothetical protein
MKFALQEIQEPRYFVRTDIDSSGMSAMLVKRVEHADTWDTRAEAERFLRRCAEKAPKIMLEVVTC